MVDLKPHVDDTRVEARRIVVKRLASIGGTAAVPPLAHMADDRDAVVAAHALTALSTLIDGTYREVAAQSLRRRSGADYDAILAVAKDQIGAPGLLALLLGLPIEPKTHWYRQKAVFDALDQLHDPRGANALVQFSERADTHPHYKFRAAAELAQIGDARAVPLLALRLRMDPLKIYSDEHEWELRLKRDDNERVVAARLIADLAALHPDRVATFRAQAETALLFWASELPSPHANSMRALAALGSKEVLPSLRTWAFPTAPLPKEGQQPPMPEEWIIAQSAQRYLGQLRDPASFKPLVANLKARPPEIDVTMDGLMAGGIAILGMSLRAIGVGAAQGLSEWGDPRGFQPLLAYVRDARNNEQSQFEACKSLAWLGRKPETAQLVAEVLRPTPGKAEEWRRQCLLEGLAQRGTNVNSRRLLTLLEPSIPDTVRSAAVRAMARAGIDASLGKDLVMRASDDESGVEAILALVLAGTPEAAVQSLQQHVRDLTEPRARLAAGIGLALGYLSQEDVDRGFLFTVLRNADAAAAAGHEWLQRAVIHALSSVVYDNGPHSLTRVVLRQRLQQMTQAKEPEHRQRALRALWYLRERGTLLALASGSGPDAELARTQAELLLKPAVPCEECPNQD